MVAMVDARHLGRRLPHLLAHGPCCAAQGLGETDRRVVYNICRGPALGAYF